MNVKFGESYHCRICGRYHSSGIVCSKKMLPLQLIQIRIEELEKIFADSSMSIEERKNTDELVEKLRKLLNVPKKEIYNTSVFLGIGDIKKELKPKIGKIFKKEEEFKYNPSKEILKEAESVLTEIFNIATKKVNLTTGQGKTMMDILYSLNQKVLKK